MTFSLTMSNCAFLRHLLLHYHYEVLTTPNVFFSLSHIFFICKIIKISFVYSVIPPCNFVFFSSLKQTFYIDQCDLESNNIATIEIVTILLIFAFY